MPERLIGAVLKTVERSRVPWVRIPPPPDLSPERDFFSMWDEYPTRQSLVIGFERVVSRGWVGCNYMLRAD